MGEEKEKPLTRKDVEAKMKEHGGSEGLNLSEQTFVEAIDLSDLDLHGIILKDARFSTHFEGDQLVGAKFDGSNLNGADLRNVNLQYAQFGMLGKQPTRLEGADLGGTILLNANFQGADLTAAQFQGKPIIPSDPSQAAQFQGKLWEILPASLEETDFRDANLFLANFKGCYFYSTKLEGAFIRGADIFDAHLEEADWGNYKIGEEIGEGARKDLYAAEHRYRHLKLWYNNNGYHDIAAKFYYREKEANRKSLKWYSRHRLALESLRVLFGYGEDWKRVLYWMALVVFGSAAAYYLSGELNLLYSLYFSVISFTALGYGKWVDIVPQGWVQALGAFQSVTGVFLMALLLVTFFRKWTR